MRPVTSLLMPLVCCVLLRADTTVNVYGVEKMVVFIYPANPDGTADKNHPLGTGFLISIPLKGAPQTLTAEGGFKGEGFLYLITARHIVDPEWAFCAQHQPTSIYLRLNRKLYDAKKDGTGVGFVKLDLIEKGRKRYSVRNDDNTVDAAVLQIPAPLLSQDEYAYEPMGLAVFATDEEIKALRIGDSIVSAGLLPGRSGEQRNYPFFKFGAISNIPNEKTWINCERGMPELTLERVWFIAINLVSGNSGSPVFYDPSPLCRLGGFIHCTRGLNRSMIVGIQSSSFEAADIAGMTPVEDVFKLIEQAAPSNADLYRGDVTTHYQQQSKPAP